MKIPLSTLLRSAFAIFMMLVGIYLLAISVNAWYDTGFSIITSKEKGKDAFSGIFFSIAFIAYAIWDLVNIIKKSKT